MRHTAAAVAVALLALAGCDGDAPGTDDPDGEPATDATDDTGAEDAADGAAAASDQVDPASIADGEVLPGVRLEVPAEVVATTSERAAGRTYVGALDDEDVGIFVEAAPGGPDVATRTADVEGVEEAEQGSVEEPSTTVEVDGVDEAARVVVTDASGRVRATVVAASVGSTAVTVVVEAPIDSSFDVDALLATLAIDPDRLGG